MIVWRALTLYVRAVASFVTSGAAGPALCNQRGSITVDTAFIHAVSANVTVLAQQREAKVSSAAVLRREEGVVGVTKDFETIAAITLQNLTSRHQDTPILNPAHGRRRAFFTDAGGGVYVDKVDEVKMLIDANSVYAQSLARAQNRKFDDLVIAAFNAAATDMSSADTVTGTTALPSAQITANGGTNLTMTKINTMVAKFNADDVDEEDRYFVYSPAGMQKLLGDSTVTSSDFSTIQALTRGTFPQDATWMGLKWRRSTRLPISGNIRSCFGWQKNAMGLAVGLVSDIMIDKVPTKLNSTLVQLVMSAGAVRIDDKGVYQIDIDESA